MSDSPDETGQLLRCSTRHGRRKVLATFFTRHRPRLRRMVQLRLDRRLRARVDPSDVLQEVYIEAAERVDEYLGNPAVSVFVWLRVLTGQKIQTFHRRHLGAKARDVRREISLYHGAMPQATSEALAAQLLGQGTSPSDAAVRAERKVHLQEALNSMDPADREVLALRHFEQLSNAEAAEVLGIQEPAARQRYVRAVKRLRDVLEKMPGGEESPP